DEKKAGKYRKEAAVITGSKYPLPSPKQLPSLMQDFLLQIKTYRKSKHPVEVAALCHKEFVFIHPFIDGNGRVARLLMNLILLQEGYSVAVIPPITRSAYIESLELSHVQDKEFIHFIASRVRETQKDFIRLFLSQD
ncbi:MAG: Fic family protein, partial [Chlamydiae bacterium]|nr:Fic family protein [Chlamydiota bacterium]